MCECVCTYVLGIADTYLLREKRDDLSTDGAETFHNLRLSLKTRKESERGASDGVISVIISTLMTTEHVTAPLQGASRSRSGKRKELWKGLG